MSPAGKIPTSKAKARKKPATKSGTGVAAANVDHPASTNVSSPVQAKSRRRMQQRIQNTSFHNANDEKYGPDDHFIVADEEMEETQDDSEDGFEPVREATKPRTRTKRQLGPPITIDEKLEGLNSIHKAVVEDFLIHAKRKCKEVSLKGISKW